MKKSLLAVGAVLDFVSALLWISWDATDDYAFSMVTWRELAFAVALLSVIATALAAPSPWNELATGILAWCGLMLAFFLARPFP